MKSAALALGPYNITVNALIPGLIDTPLTRHKERYAQVIEDTALRQPAGQGQDDGPRISVDDRCRHSHS
jgi:NAD(P)-dependent dehydrogenase (short-subunit alcohol dehydrogenase family)